MMTSWRVVTNSSHKDYDYVAVEFDMNTGQMDAVRLDSGDTTVRLDSTPPFEIEENGEWMTIPYEDVKGLIQETNAVRKRNGFDPITEDDVKAKLYEAQRLR